MKNGDRGIQEELNKLTESITVHEKHYAELVAKLEPILKPNARADNEEPPDIPDTSIVASHLRDLTRRMERSNMNLGDLIDLIDL